MFPRGWLEPMVCPIMLNNYSTCSFDVRPKDFKTVEIDYVSNEAVEFARKVLGNP